MQLDLMLGLLFLLLCQLFLMLLGHLISLSLTLLVPFSVRLHLSLLGSLEIRDAVVFLSLSL